MIYHRKNWECACSIFNSKDVEFIHVWFRTHPSYWVRLKLTDLCVLCFAGISGALHAVKSGNSEVLRYFLEKGYNVNQTDTQARIIY